MKKLILILAIFFAVVFLLGGIIYFQEVKRTSANLFYSLEPFSSENSYVFVSPLKAKANGEEQIRITIFLLNSQGIGVKNTKVELRFDPELTVTNTQDITDPYGKAIFDVSTTTPGKYEVEIFSQGKKLQQTAVLEFIKD
ncbi:MAG: hypothetical protein KatS3mg090_0656 [Patescibacteria group bacterium]|nr:MAG: hypothetical protein KatS3mg090_0656 [Patescibacteria group bacterium]